MSSSLHGCDGFRVYNILILGFSIADFGSLELGDNKKLKILIIDSFDDIIILLACRELSPPP